jgi:competence protein CoiA
MLAAEYDRISRLSGFAPATIDLHDWNPEVKATLAGLGFFDLLRLEVDVEPVLAQKGQHKIAIEIQWSGQTNQETLYRRERYWQSGVRCLWLFRRPGFPVSKDLPAACVSGDIAMGFEARLSDEVMPLHKFLDAVFARRFRYGIVPGSSGRVSIHSGVLDCWRSNSQARTRIVTFIEVVVDLHRCQFTVPV